MNSPIYKKQKKKTRILSVILWLLMPAPFLNLLWGGFTRGGFDANPVEFVQLETGWAATFLFLLVLYISALKSIFPQFSLLKILAKHKRLMGISCFIYVLTHLSIYLLDSGDIKTLTDNLKRPFILFGMGAFFILLLLAVTSWNGAIRIMGGKKWKWLHRCSYLAILLVFVHMIAKEKSNILETLSYFLPLLTLQIIRYIRFVKHKNSQSGKVRGNPAKSPSIFSE